MALPNRLRQVLPVASWPLPAHPPTRGAGSSMDLSLIRNFSIIAHIDHGKSTLSDRILEITKAVDARDMRKQYLDSMDLERERGITIKAQNVRVDWRGHTLHLIDTPGHVDFGYEVSRSLAACEGVVLVVDAAQGIEAQTLANCYLALENDLEIVAALNKIDLPAADPDRYAMEIETVLGIPAEDILRISAKTGDGVDTLLDAICERIPAPTGDPDAPLQALIFDSQYDQYRGVVSSIRVMNGKLDSGSKVLYMQANAPHEAIEIGVRRPVPTPVQQLGPGEVGYIISGIKDVGDARSGETITTAQKPAPRRCRVIATQADGVLRSVPIDGDDFENLRESLEKLKLNDASITYEPRLGCARLRLPLWLPRPAAHGDREGASGARVQPGADRHGPSVEYRVTKTTARSSWSTTRPTCRPRRTSTSSRSRSSGSASSRRRVHGHVEGPVPDPARRDEEDRVPVARSVSNWSTPCRSPRWSSTSSTR